MGRIKRMKRVIVESPYAGKSEEAIKLNEIYAELAMCDCLINYNESPYASHLLYTRPFVLRDDDPEDRKLGIKAGFCWRDVADKSVFYQDMGMTKGMIRGIEDCKQKNQPYELRQLPDDLWEELIYYCYDTGYEEPKRS